MILSNIYSYLKPYLQRILFIVIFISITFTVVYGQKKREEPPPLKERLFYGGNFGLQFGTLTNIQISPVIGLWVLPRLAVAVGPDYRFYKFLDDKTNIYGGKTYLEYIVVHEMIHLLERHHNDRFLYYMDTYLPNWRQLKDELNKLPVSHADWSY